MRACTKVGALGGPSYPKSYSCSCPHPQTPACALLVFSGLVLTPGMGLGSWGLLKPSGAQSWTRLRLEWGEGTGNSSLLSFGTLPAHARWGPLGNS